MQIFRCKMNSNYLLFFVYLFGYYQVCPAIEFAAAKEVEINKNGLIKAEEHEREKRGIFAFVIAIAVGVISTTVANLLSEQISKLIRGERLRRDTGNVALIEQRLNRNYNNAVSFKNRITQLNPEVGHAILVSAQGFRCDENFCAGKAAGHYAMGLCTKYMCYCKNGSPGPLECGGGLVFDPVGRNCNYPSNMKLCGY